jgi:hypothetical protein
MSALAWTALLVGWLSLNGLTWAVAQLFFEIRELRRELRDWRHELPASGTRVITK